MYVKSVLLLFLVSLAVVVMQNVGFYRTLRVDDTELFNIVAVDDRLQGGKSEGEVRFEDDHWVLYCEIIRSAYGWPFCEVRFEVKGADGKSVGLGLNPDGSNKGMDLSLYTEVVIAAKYRKDSSNQKYSLRYQMRNFNPEYSDEKKEDLLKYNGIEYRVEDTYPQIIEYDSMQVLSWWIADYAIPIKHQRLDVSNVHFIELATGNFMRKGMHVIDIEHITLRGKWISDATAYLAVVIMWMVSAILYLLYRLYDYQRNFSKMAQKQKELRIINQLLDSKSKELELKANRDTLTGALNRAGFDHYMTSNSIVLGLDVELSVLYLDIDFFKKVNDSHGHATGDEVLKQFSALLNANTRDSDLLVRWGGEEFVMLLPNTPIHQAARLAEKLRKIIELSPWPKEMKITMSVGVAEQRSEEMDAFLERADAALYRAKQNGRNRVEVAE